jgi:hypothetical protein
MSWWTLWRTISTRKWTTREKEEVNTFSEWVKAVRSLI